MLNGLHFILAHVPSIEQVLPFYTGKLGFEVEDQGPDFVQFKGSPYFLMKNMRSLALREKIGPGFSNVVSSEV